ncbi:MAG: 1,4-dihydroxy-2-naphthoate octaprenyltransferase [Flavobacteriales bacterium]
MNKIKDWIAAARIRTLPLSISGIIIGASFGQDFINNTIAYSEKAVVIPFYKTSIFWLAVLSTIGFQVLSNFANDYGDHLKGTDTNRIGEKRLVSSGVISSQQMKRAILLTSFLTLICVLVLIYVSFGKENFLFSILFFVLAIVSMVAAIKYTIGKNPYGYEGFGDLFVFLFFGLLSVLGSYFLFAKQLFLDLLLPAFSVGFLSAAVLNLNNMRDVVNDKLHQKNTLVVKLGTEKAKKYHYFLLITAICCALFYTSLHFQSYKQFFYVIAFIPLILNLKTVFNNKEPQLLDGELKKVAFSTFLFAILFSLLH